MGKAFAVGEKHLIMGFKSVGFEIDPVENRARFPETLGRLAQNAEVALVLATESIAAEADEAIAAFRERSPAILTLIPSHEGSQHTSFDATRRAVERSLGVDILGKEPQRTVTDD